VTNRCADCPLIDLNNKGDCYLQSREDAKNNEMLQTCFHSLDEHGVFLLENLYLHGADLEGVTIQKKRLSGADFSGASLRRAYLFKSSFEFSRLDHVDFEGAVLEQVDLREVISIQGAKLHNTILSTVLPPNPQLLDKPCIYDHEQSQDLHKAEYVYRHLKEIYKADGQHEASGIFYEHEMEMRRRQSHGLQWLHLSALCLSCGYGERPERSILFGLSIIVLFAFSFYFLPLAGPNGTIYQDFIQALYFSTITFTTLGYGDIHPEGIGRLFAAAEAVIGIFTAALFVFVFTRSMTR
jgi:hypothetical protein